jgi:predicted DCC family thiol-disulfide oxidoreductase YuxK
MRGHEEAVLLYDRDCGFCVWSAHLLGTWDRRNRLAFVPIQSDEGARLLAAIPPAARLMSMHVVTPDGVIRSGGTALPTALRSLAGGSPLAWIAEAMPGTAERAYRVVSRHRGTLGRLLGREGCRADTRSRLAPMR